MALILRVVVLAALAAFPAAAPWTPRIVWTRDLGEGFSGFALGGREIVTMYRRGNDEVIVALDRASGKTLWEHAYGVPTLEGQDLSQGPGPHATPVVYNDLVCAAGVTGRLTCLNIQSGRVRWSKELIIGLGGTVVYRGYSSTPVVHGPYVIAPVGGDKRALVAFHADTGRELWRGGSFANTNSSPLYVVAGRRCQVIAFMADVIVGLSADTGEQLWTHPHPQRFKDNISRPLWLPDLELLIVSSALDGGTRALRIDETGVREVWHQPRAGTYYTNLMPIGGLVVLSSGGIGPTFFSALDLSDGRILWQTRDIKRANGVVVGGALLLRDEDGGLSIARASAHGAAVEREALILTPGAPSPPSVNGTTIYVRDRQRAMAIDIAVR